MEQCCCCIAGALRGKADVREAWIRSVDMVNIDRDTVISSEPPPYSHFPELGKQNAQVFR